MAEKDEGSDRLPVVASVLREFVVDFLSSMVPGFLFTMFAVPLCIGAVIVLYPAGFNWKGIEGGMQQYHAEIVWLGLVFSYVLGCIFSRRDPKIPDQKSAAYILRKDWKDRAREVIQYNPNFDYPKGYWFLRLAAGFSKRANRWLEASRLANGPGGQFPYSHLYEYLECRKLHHLAVRVPWHGDDISIDSRSKMFINILKIRLQFRNQKRCGDIVRNEAHVRMMSSVWFAARQLIWVCKILLILVAAFALLKRLISGIPQPLGATQIIALLALFYVGSQWLCWSIIKFLHYQRVREIVYVLETAHTAFESGQEDIFDGLQRSGNASQ